MTRLRALPLLAAFASPLVAASPADTYFALAVTENSHNHGGSNLLFLDFQEQADPTRISPQVVISPRVADGAIVPDGKLDDWDPAHLTVFPARVMNNYPLSEFYDVVPVDIRVGSAWDGEHIYFVVDFEDANHDASIDRNRWQMHDGKWRKQPHVTPNPGAPAARAVNRDDTLTGVESEDRVFFMFPIVDRQRAFRDGGFGCAAYCHANLVDSGDPAHEPIGEGVVAMHTALEGDMADIWHWQATRSRPANTLKDAHLVHGEGSYNGRKSDDGQTPDLDNDAKALGFGDASVPAYVSRADFEAGRYATAGHRTESLTEDDLLRITPEMRFADGVSVPFSITRPSTGSRADVLAVARYDRDTHRWTVELRRKLDTGDDKDRQFVAGTDAPPPRAAPVVPGDVAAGASLYRDRCQSCHGEDGAGKREGGHWHYPRNQRASGPLIYKTASPERPERMRELAWRSKATEAHTEHRMSFVPLTAQEAEDIGAWLQTRFTPLGQ